MIAPRPSCRHCHAHPVNRPRGLCWSCYYAPGVRDLYAITSKYAIKGNGGAGDNPRGRLPARPTNAEPGSDAKVEVMMERARRRESLSHPDDLHVADYPAAWLPPARKFPFGRTSRRLPHVPVGERADWFGFGAFSE